MGFGNFIMGAFVTKLLLNAVKKSGDNSQDISEVFTEKNNGGSVRNNKGTCILKPDSSGIIPGKGIIFRLHPVPPCKDIPDSFTPYEGADMTCAEADAAGFEFKGFDRYHGVDDVILKASRRRDISGKYFNIPRWSYNCAGIPGCVITGWHGKDETVKVPETIGGRPVVKIENGAFGEKNIREIYLPDCLLEIGDDAFGKCTALTRARLSKELMSIGRGAFWRCERLENVYLGNVWHIGACAFGYCSAIREVRLSDTVEYIGDRAFADSGIEKIYWNKIGYAGDHILSETPFWKQHSYIVLGGNIQKCYFRTDGKIAIADFGITRIGSEAFVGAQAEKITFTYKVKEIGSRAFRTGDAGQDIKEIYVPGAFRFGSECFEKGQKITVSKEAEFTSSCTAAVGYLYLEEDSFADTDMEKRYVGGSCENPCVCVMVRSILVRVETGQNAGGNHVPREILTLSEDGSTLIMDDRVHYTAAKHIPNLGAKKLILSRNTDTLRSFASVEDFKEIVIQKPGVYAREKSPFRPKKSVIIRFDFDLPAYGKPIDSAVLLYLPSVVKDSPEAEKLYALYDRCLGMGFNFFNFDLYDCEILNLVSSYRARFTIARLRLEGGFGLQPEARERYRNFLLAHRRKAEFTAKKHGDTALLSLLEKLSEKTPTRKGALHNKAPQSSPRPVSVNAVRPVPANPDTDVPDYFTPYEGADMTCAEAAAAGFEFVGADRYHGVDFWLRSKPYKNRNLIEEVTYVGRGEYCRGGIPGCVITGWHGSDEIVKIPRTINGRPVVKIEKGAFAKKQIKEIYLPDSVIDISDHAFEESALTYARLSKALVHIGKGAFSECALLERVYMGNVRVIDERAFFECGRLRQVRLPEEVWYIKDRAFAGSGLERLYWNRIMHSDSYIIFYTPFDKRHELIVLGDTLQRCSTCAPNELIIDIPGVTAVGDYAFEDAAAKKITFSDKIHVIGYEAFGTGLGSNEIEEVYAPEAWILDNYCFKGVKSYKGVTKITVSEEAQNISLWCGSPGYLYLQSFSFGHTNIEKCYDTGYNKDGIFWGCRCTMVRNILVRVSAVKEQYPIPEYNPRGVFTFSGDTVIMDDSVRYTAAPRIPCMGAKKIILSKELEVLHSLKSLEEFEEIVFRNSYGEIREKLPFRPKSTVTLRFDGTYVGTPKKCSLLLYLPNVTKNSAEAEKLYDLYDRCIRTAYEYGHNVFKFDRYDREILTIVSSYRARFTIARMRLEVDYELKPEARERYENFLLTHKRKAEFTAKKHGDTALLSLLEKLTEKNND